jgi:hypothetical protein
MFRPIWLSSIVSKFIYYIKETALLWKLREYKGKYRNILQGCYYYYYYFELDWTIIIIVSIIIITIITELHYYLYHYY